MKQKLPFLIAGLIILFAAAFVIWHQINPGFNPFSKSSVETAPAKPGTAVDVTPPPGLPVPQLSPPPIPK
jgi:hypothetical protein